jgi:glycerol-3-phosphate dehydrogenase (NAD(P)+)
MPAHAQTDQVQIDHVQIIGGGSWGLALAAHLARLGRPVRLWCREEDKPAQLRETRRSPFFLPGFELPGEVEVVDEVATAPEVAVFAVPSHAMRDAATRFVFPPGTLRVSVAKGIETDTLERMSEVLAGAAPGGPVAALSGPSHAEEVAFGLPASLVAASPGPEPRTRIQEVFNSDTLRVYTSPDLTGVELGGALKNVVAIAAGICDGLALGDNARAALITRGLAEMRRLGEAYGAQALTFAGLSGMGDLIVTCTSRHSRNRALGEGIAQGKSLEALLGGSPMVSEGVRTAKAARALAARANIDMPITSEVCAMLFEGKSPADAIRALLTRDPRPEV